MCIFRLDTSSVVVLHPRWVVVINGVGVGWKNENKAKAPASLNNDYNAIIIDVKFLGNFT